MNVSPALVLLLLLLCCAVLCCRRCYCRLNAQCPGLLVERRDTGSADWTLGRVAECIGQRLHSLSGWIPKG